MSRESIVFVLGLVVFLTTFSGLLWDWKKIIFIVVGVLLMILGYSLRRSSFLRSFETGGGERASDAFVEAPHTDEKKEKGEEDNQE